ncbi:MAG: DciA family protein [Pseudomonadota bacterium]
MAAKATTEKKRKMRRRGFAKASAEARGALDTVASKQGFAEPDILLRWPEIAGAAYGSLCQPVKIRYGANRTMGATLMVQTDSGRAPEVEHQAPRILERINQFYGYRAITRLKVTQSTGMAAAPSGFAEEPARFAGKGAPHQTGTQSGASHADATPDADDISRAEELAAGIASPDLRAALTRMGSHVLARSRKTERNQPTTR